MDPRTSEMERQVLVDELHRYQMRDHESSTVLAITYILATLLVVVIIMAFMQGRSFIAGCKRLARKVKRTAKKAAKTVKAKFDELTGQSNFKAVDNLTTDMIMTTGVKKGCVPLISSANMACPGTDGCSDAVCMKAVAAANAKGCGAGLTVLGDTVGACAASSFADTIQEFDEVLNNFYDDPTPSGFADLEEHFEDVKELFEDAVVEHFQWEAADSSINPVYKGTPLPNPAIATFADDERFADLEQTFDDLVQQSNFYAAAAANATSTPKAANAAKKAVATAKTAVKVVAAVPKAAGKAAVPAVVKTIANAKGAITDAKKTAAGVPKTAKVAPAPVKVTRSTRIKSDNQIDSVTTFPTGFPETVPDPNILDFDQLDADQYSSLIVNEVADARTIANHNEWVKEVGKQNTLPMDIMRDGFEISDYYHGRGAYMFSPSRPKSFGLNPMQQEF